MPCGCTGACNCTVVGDGVTAEVARIGDKFIVSAILPIRTVADTDCIALDIDDDLQLTATPILADAGDEDASVQLRCTADGLVGDVVIDPASTAPVTLTDDGLRIDLPPPPATTDSASPGALRVTAALGDDAGWLDADGAEVSRLTFPALFDSVSLVTDGAETTLGSAQITSVRTRGLGPGMPLEVDGFPPGTAILTIDGPFTLTATFASGVTAVDVTVRAYPYGDGDGAGTFNLPLVDEEGYVVNLATGQALGAQVGANSVALTEAELAPHDHGANVTDPGHAHTASTSVTIAAAGNHTHPGAGANHDFVVQDTGAADFAYVHIDAHNVDTLGTVQISSNGVEGGNSYKRNREANTAAAGSHGHAGSTGATTVDPSGTGVTVDVLDAGSGDAHENRPLSRSFRWQVKT